METLNNLLKSIDNQLFKEIAFGLFALITLFGAGYLLVSRNVLYSAYALLLSFVGMAGLYVFAGADFVAVTQIMVYVGGILVLLIFGVMLTKNMEESKPQESRFEFVKHQETIASLFIALVLSGCFLTIIFDANLPQKNTTQLATKTIPTLGIQLMTDYVFIFEVIGIFLLVALIGAAHIAKKTT